MKWILNDYIRICGIYYTNSDHVHIRYMQHRHCSMLCCAVHIMYIVSIHKRTHSFFWNWLRMDDGRISGRTDAMPRSILVCFIFFRIPISFAFIWRGEIENWSGLHSALSLSLFKWLKIVNPKYQYLKWLKENPTQ